MSHSISSKRVLELLRQFESRNLAFVDPDGAWPIVWDRAGGVHVWDADGKKYLDLTAAFGVAAAGHAVRNGDIEFAAASAKLRVGEAAGKVCDIVHQVHGAIGFTHEHRLHHFTRRLWSWRDEFGVESQWALDLGRLMIAEGADGLWPFLAAR